MKKVTLLLITLCLLWASCGRDDDSINYSGKETLNIVLLEELNLNATSDLELSYHSDNELVVTVTPDGVIKGKNVGEANVTISNSVNSITLKVVVSLFEEPTFNFGISQDGIIDIYGEPNYNFGDTIFIYGSGNNWYSYAVWEMDFFFYNNQYIEADLYIRSDVETRMNEYLNSNYFFQYNDTINDLNCDIYYNEENPEDATLLLGKVYGAGQYDDICLFYIPFDYEEKNDYRLTLQRIRKKLTK